MALLKPRLLKLEGQETSTGGHIKIAAGHLPLVKIKRSCSLVLDHDND